MYLFEERPVKVSEVEVKNVACGARALFISHAVVKSQCFIINLLFFLRSRGPDPIPRGRYSFFILS